MKSCDTKFLRSQPSLWQKIKSACRLYFYDHKAKKAGAWGCQIPNKFLPVYIQGGTCSTLCDVSGAYADLGRHASVEIGFLLEMMHRVVAGFHMENVFGGFSVRRVYDRFLKEISTSYASVSVNDHRGVSVDRREERKRRRKASAVSGSIIIFTGVTINNITVFMT